MLRVTYTTTVRFVNRFNTTTVTVLAKTCRYLYISCYFHTLSRYAYNYSGGAHVDL